MFWDKGIYASAESINPKQLAQSPQTELGCWLNVLRFNITLTANVILWWPVTRTCSLAFPHQCQHSFSVQSHQLLFPHASAEVRGENTPERKFVSTGYQTHNHQVMSLTHSPLSQMAGAS